MNSVIVSLVFLKPFLLTHVITIESGVMARGISLVLNNTSDLQILRRQWGLPSTAGRKGLCISL